MPIWTFDIATFPFCCFHNEHATISSANVPDHFDASDPTTDLVIVERARELSDELQGFRNRA
jgi:hypothetical protein